MILLPLLLAALGSPDVDMTWTPVTQCAPVNSIVEVSLVLSAGAPVGVSAYDAILTWNPAELQFQSAVVGAGGWFVTGFLNDPDGINLDLQDGDALFTALANPGSPVMLPPNLSVVTFRFKVLADAQLQLTPTLGLFGETKVLGTSPGQVLTGTLSGPATISTMVGPASEVSRAGVPPNPSAFLPGVTTGPIVGQAWDPVVDHSSFVPGSVFDAMILTPGPVNVPLPPYGTLLCQLPWWGQPFTTAPGVPFSIFLPFDCSLVGASFCSQAFSIDALGNAKLTNALDATIGSF